MSCDFCLVKFSTNYCSPSTLLRVKGGFLVVVPVVLALATDDSEVGASADDWVFNKKSLHGVGKRHCR